MDDGLGESNSGSNVECSSLEANVEGLRRAVTREWPVRKRQASYLKCAPHSLENSTKSVNYSSGGTRNEFLYLKTQRNP